MLLDNMYYVLDKIIDVGRCGVEVWLKFGRSLVEVWCRSLVDMFIKCTMCVIDIPSKLRPNFDTGCVEVWSKFDVEVWSKFRHWGCRSLVEISTKLRPPSVEVWSN